MRILINERISQHKYKTPEGYLVCVDSVLARTGKQEYHRNEIFATDSDEIVEVDRKPEEVFNEKTIASFENKPVTVEHPDEDVNVDNYKDYAVGFVRDVKKGIYDGQDVLLGTLVITDAKTIEEIENGEHTELSCGYDCDILDSDNPEQKNIRGNHVALCERGRAGIAKIIDSVKDDEECEVDTLKRLIQEEQSAINSYKLAIQQAAKENDPESIKILTHIMKEEEEHLKELNAKLNGEPVELEDGEAKFFFKCSVDGKYYVSADPMKIKELNPKSKNVWILEQKGNKFMDFNGGTMKYINEVKGDKEAASSYCEQVGNCSLLDSENIVKIRELKFGDKIKLGVSGSNTLYSYIGKDKNDYLFVVDGTHHVIRLDDPTIPCRVIKNLTKDNISLLERKIIEQVKNEGVRSIGKLRQVLKEIVEINQMSNYEIKELVKKLTGVNIHDMNYNGYDIQIKPYCVEVWKGGKKVAEFATEDEANEWVKEMTKDSIKDASDDLVKKLIKQGKENFEIKKELEKADKNFDWYEADEYINSIRESMGLKTEDSVKDKPYWEEEDDPFYYGREEYEKYGDKVLRALRGKVISKERDKSEEPGGLAYEAKKLGMDKIELLRTLEGLCYNRKARELFPGNSYKVGDSLSKVMTLVKAVKKDSKVTDKKSISHEKIDELEYLIKRYKEKHPNAKVGEIYKQHGLYYVDVEDSVKDSSHGFVLKNVYKLDISDERWNKAKQFLQSKGINFTAGDDVEIYTADRNTVVEFAKMIGWKGYVADKPVIIE